jgi:hypothetical protein
MDSSAYPKNIPAALTDILPETLQNVLRKDLEKLPEILQNPPKFILVHAYPAKKAINGNYRLDEHGIFARRGVATFIQKVRKSSDPDYRPTIILPNVLKDWGGISICDIFEKNFRDFFVDRNILGVSFEVESQSSFSQRSKETLGELEFGESVENQEKILSVSHIAHEPRIQKLLSKNHFDNEIAISYEALILLEENSIEILGNFLSAHREEMQISVAKFFRAEQYKLFLANFFRGHFLQFLTRVLGGSKQKLLKSVQGF